MDEISYKFFHQSMKSVFISKSSWHSMLVIVQEQRQDATSIYYATRCHDIPLYTRSDLIHVEQILSLLQRAIIAV